MSRVSKLSSLCALFAMGMLVGPAAATIHEVRASGLTFTPDDLTINLGDTVRWVRMDGSHTVTSGTPCAPDGRFDAPLDLNNPTFEFTFTNAATYSYFCTPHCVFGMTGVIRVSDPSALPDSPDRVDAVRLAAWPNPARGSTELRLHLPGAGEVQVLVFDAGGREVARLHDGSLSSGDHQIAWNGKTSSGEDARGGVYFARARGAAGSAGLTLLLLR